jgi:hypothetical protein
MKERKKWESIADQSGPNFYNNAHGKTWQLTATYTKKLL